MKKTQVTEKTLVKSPSESKILCLTHNFYNFSIKNIFYNVQNHKNK